MLGSKQLREVTGLKLRDTVAVAMDSDSGIASSQAVLPYAEKPRLSQVRSEESPTIVGRLAYWWALAAAFLLFVSLGLYHLGMDRILSGRNDFAPMYAATQAVGTPHMYHKQRTYDVIISEFGDTSYSWRYTRMPFHAAALWPLSRLSYRSAYGVYLALQISAVAAFVVLWRMPSASHTLLFTVLSFPVYFSLLTGQDTVFLLLWIALAVRCESRGRPFRAGVFLSFCAIKFHLFMFLPLLLIGQRRWRMLGGAAAGGSVLLGVSFLAAGIRWPLDYYETLTDPIINPAPYLMVNLHGLFVGLGAAPALDVASAVVVAAAVWFAARRSLFLEGLAVTLIAGILASYHTYTGDCVLIIPAATILLCTVESPWTRFLSAVALTPFLFVTILEADWAYGVQGILLSLFCISVAHILRRGRVRVVDSSSKPVLEAA